MDCLGQRLAMMEVCHFETSFLQDTLLSAVGLTLCRYSCSRLALAATTKGRWAHSRLDCFSQYLAGSVCKCIR